MLGNIPKPRAIPPDEFEVPATAGDNHLVREAMCQTKGIEPALKKAYEDNDDWLTWVYFGSKTGVYRM